MVTEQPEPSGVIWTTLKGDQLVQLFEALGHPALHPAGDHGIAGLHGLVDRGRPDERPAAEVLEHQRVERHVAGCALELEGLRDPVRRRGPVEDAAEPVLRAVGVDAHVSPGASVPDVELVHAHREAAWAKPLGEELGLRVGAKDKLTRCGDLPLEAHERGAGVGSEAHGRGHGTRSSCVADGVPATCPSASSVASSSSKRSKLSSQNSR